MIGRIFTEEWKQKISESLKGEKSYRYGTKYTEEEKKQIGETLKKSKKWQTAIHDPNRCKKIVETRRKLNNYKHSDETKKRLSNVNKGRKHTEETNKKISVKNSGQCRSNETKRKLRLSTIKRITENKLNGGQLYPRYNPIACEYFNNLMEQTGTYIQHAQNGGEYNIKELGYWVDGYDIENNIVYEYDEIYHNSNLTKDKQRQKEIEEFLGCKFVRIKE